MAKCLFDGLIGCLVFWVFAMMMMVDGERSDGVTSRRDVVRVHPHRVGEGIYIYSVSLYISRRTRDGRARAKAHRSHLPQSHRAVSASIRGHPFDN